MSQVQNERLPSLSLTRSLCTIPAQKRITTSACIVGNIPASTLTAGVTGFFYTINSPYQPFNTAAKPDSATGFITEVNGSDTENPNGYTLFAQMYSFAKVLRARLRVTCVPSSAGDQVMLCAYTLPSNVSPPLSFTRSRAQAHYKENVCYVGNRADMNTVDIACSSAAAMGMTETQFRDQQPVAFATNSLAPNTTWNFVVQYFMMDGALNGSAVTFRIEMVQEILLYGPIQPVG